MTEEDDVNGRKSICTSLLIDWKRLAELANAQGCEAFISEREYYHFEGSDGTAISAAEFDYNFLRNL